jgi:HicB family
VARVMPPDPPAPPPPAVPPAPPALPESGDVARITLRLPEGLKDSVERAAAAEALSVNAWLVRAVAAAIEGGPAGRGPSAPGPAGRVFGRRITGYAQA